MSEPANVSGTIKKELIETATATKNNVDERLAAERLKLEAAMRSVSDAEKTVNGAIAEAARGGGSADASVMVPLQQARAQAEFQERLVAALVGVAAEAHVGLKAALHQAHVPMYRLGMQVRIDAGRKADEARALIQSAREDHRRGTQILETAMQRGAQHPGGLRSMSHPAFTFEHTNEAGERDYWTASGADTEWDYLPEAQRG